MKYGTQMNVTTVTSPVMAIHSEADVRAICEAFAETYSRLYTPEAAYPEGGIDVDSFALKAWVPQRHYQFMESPLESPLPDSLALKETRDVYWEEYMGFRPTKVYEYDRIKPGNVIEGPAVIEAVHTTYVIAPGYRFTLDKYRNGIMEMLR